jgi:pSer/pThr/pTyr-binding forkhead associated (FHA) protein
VAFRLRFGLEEVDLAAQETTIGRDASCSVSIDDDLVSRTHAVFRRHDGFVEATDLGSRNGTRVNGVAIREPTRLRHGDRIRLGPREDGPLRALRRDDPGRDAELPSLRSAARAQQRLSDLILSGKSAA